MAQVVILGSGIGGASCAYELRRQLPPEHHVTVVSAQEHFEFVPANPWVGIGWRTRKHISFPLRPSLERRGIAFVTQPCTRIAADQNHLLLGDGARLDYDYLVIATGPRLMFDEVAGAGPQGFSHSVCTLNHAELTWQAYQAFLEQPGSIVVGALPNTSCFGPAYEFAFMLDTDLRRRRMRDDIPICFVTPEPYLGHLGLGGVGESRAILEQAFRHRQIRWIANARVLDVAAAQLRLETLDQQGLTVGEQTLPFRFSMMMPGFSGIEAVASVPGLCNRRGFVLVDEYQRNPRYSNIYAAGVCVAIPPVDNTPIPIGSPRTGYMTESMVAAIVHNLRDVLHGQEPRTKANWNAICLADMGDSGIAFVALPQTPPRRMEWAKQGKWVHLAKVAFERYFMRKMKMGVADPIYEKYVLRMLGIGKFRNTPW